MTHDMQTKYDRPLRPSTRGLTTNSTRAYDWGQIQR